MSIASAHRNASETKNSGGIAARLQETVRTRRDTGIMRQIRGGVSLIGLAAATTLASQPAAAQVVPPPNVVGVCSGVSLPKSVVTEIMRPVIGGVVTPIENTLNPILTTVNRILLLPLVGGLIPALPATTQTIDVDGLLTSAANGDNITLSVLDVNGNAVGPNSNCVSQADGFELRNPAGIAIGGNRITGLGATGAAAFAGEANSIAFGNAALTDATALGAIALGTNSSVGANATGAVALGTGASATGANGVALGAGSLAARGPQAGYTAIGLAVPQNSAAKSRSVRSAANARSPTSRQARRLPTRSMSASSQACRRRSERPPRWRCNMMTRRAPKRRSAASAPAYPRSP